MVHWTTDSDRDKRRVDQALDILRQALIKYLGNLPRGSRRAYGSLDLQRLLNAFIDRFPELTLPTRTRTLAFAAKDARNEVAHYTGAMTPHDALRHLANVRQLLKDLDADTAFGDVDGLYGEHLDGRGPDVDDRARSVVAPVTAPARAPNPPPASIAGGVKGKYALLYGHLLALADDQWDATFPEVEAVLGGPLPASARKHPAWWSNTTSLASGKSWLAAGWRTRNVRIAEERVSFVRLADERSDIAAASSSGLIYFENDDTAYLEWLGRNRDGYVVNVRHTLASDYVVLHRATCTRISGLREPGAYTERYYRKFCGRTLDDVAEAPTWCGRSKGSFTKRCSICGA